MNIVLEYQNKFKIREAIKKRKEKTTAHQITTNYKPPDRQYKSLISYQIAISLFGQDGNLKWTLI